MPLARRPDADEKEDDDMDDDMFDGDDDLAARLKEAKKLRYGSQSISISITIRAYGRIGLGPFSKIACFLSIANVQRRRLR